MGGSQSISCEHRPVLIGVDGSDHSKRALDWYFNVFRGVLDPEAKRPVIMVYNIENEPATESGGLSMLSLGGGEPSKDHLAKLKSYSAKLEADLMRQCAEKNAKCEFRERYGRPGECIVDESKLAEAALIIVGTRGQSTLRRTIMGSVSDYVVHQSDIPVTVVPPPK